mgnify:CR=1 FL=1
MAFNAPITGIVFAMEEAFRSFSPQVFICASISVITSLVTRNAIRSSLDFTVGFAFDGFVFADFAFKNFNALEKLFRNKYNMVKTDSRKRGYKCGNRKINIRKRARF